MSAGKLDRMSLAPQPQGRLLGLGLKFVPLIERVPPRQGILETGVGAPAAEKFPNLVKITRQELAGKVERDWLAEVKFLPVGYGLDARFVKKRTLRPKAC
jgi:hypothetical protein